jgi:hypothetical protein
MINEDSLLVPLDAWNTVLINLVTLHEASQQMAEARESVQQKLKQRQNFLGKS